MDSDPIKQTVQKICDSYSDHYVKESFELLLKLLGNILKNPTEEKFRVFKKTNEALKKKVLIIKENLQLLKDIGYVDIDQDILAFNGNHFTNIEKAVKLLEAKVEAINSSMLSQEDIETREREERAQQNKEEIIRKMREEREKQKIIKAQIEADHKEMLKREKPTDSNAKPLEFGATIKKFEPPKGGGKR